jgi:hypothetical protein
MSELFAFRAFDDAVKLTNKIGTALRSVPAASATPFDGGIVVGAGVFDMGGVESRVTKMVMLAGPGPTVSGGGLSGLVPCEMPS